ncbi:uncharacterized protein LOC133174762 [Saccostrea echinata]|uniref:uncharacterized protein LOC133174762 n=1 Tax=Saccostrea echinata TaxID=191078 RepID=UPI002A83EF83|nr:uncharacterized protein LOC133174762 [Saccostrea echinata]
MNGIGSIRVSGGFPLSLSTRCISLEIESLKLEFILSCNWVQEELERELRVFYACVEWPDTTDTELYIRCTDPARDILNWKKDVEGCFEHFVNTISVSSTPLESREYSHISQRLESLQKIRIKYDVDSRKVYVVGERDFVERAIMEIENLLTADLSQEKQKVIRLSCSEVFLLVNSDIEKEITKQVKNIKVSLNLTKNEIQLFGSEEALHSACMVISSERYGIKERLVGSLSPEKRYLIGLSSAKRILGQKIRASNALCYIDTSSADAVKLFAFTENDLNKSQNLLETTIIVKYIDLQGDFEGSISPLEYSSMFRQTESKFAGLVKIEYVPVEFAVRIVCVVDHIETVMKEVEIILSRSQTFEVVDLYRPCIFRYLLKTKADDIKALSQKNDVVSLTNSKLCALRVKGKYDSVLHFRDQVADVVQSIAWKQHHVSIPSKYRQSFTDICLALETQIDCKMDVVNLKCITDVQAIGRKIIVMAGSLKYVECDVMVVYANKEYKPNGRQSKLVYQAGGKLILKECRENTSEAGEPVDWTVVSTGAGKLRTCMSLLHIITPKVRSQVPLESLKTVYHLCLSTMEKQRFRSIALSCVDGVTMTQQVKALVSAINEYFERFPESGIRTIIFCDHRQSANSFLDEFMASRPSWYCFLESHLKHNVTSCSIKPGCEWNKTPSINQSSSFTVKIGQITVHGMLGDITDTRVDAIVNSSNKFLDLTKGAVSQNILIKGGTLLEDELKSTEKCREVDKQGLAVTTSGDPSQIPCLFIFHVDAVSVSRSFKVSVAWKKMVLKCLQKAEEMKLSSLAFPALGTGSLHGNIRTTSQFMLEAVEEFAKRGSIHLNQVYIIVLDQSVLMELHDTMRDRYIDNMRLWHPEYEEQMTGDVLICGESREAVNKAAQSINTTLFAIHTNT